MCRKHIYYNELMISDKIFDSVKEKLIKKANSDNGSNMQICVYKNKTRDGKYLFCEPNGDAMIIKDNKEKIIGNFINDFDNILKIWDKYVDSQLVKDNFEMTYLKVHKYE